MSPDRTIVISQPMFFPWVGLFEQIRLADLYVHYDDVQFSKGSFSNRVQIKTAAGPRWLTAPLRDLRLGLEIREVRLDDRQDWRRKHLALLSQAYAGAPHVRAMLDLVEAVYAQPATTLAEIATESIHAVAAYFDLACPDRFLVSSRLGIPGSSSRRVLHIVQSLGGRRYITGHGARHYLDHALFESEGVRVEYMDYQKAAYPQLHGAFTPFVSILDLIANCGPAGRAVLVSGTRYWSDFLGVEEEAGAC